MSNNPIFQQNRAPAPAKKIYQPENRAGMSHILGTRNKSGLTVSPATVGIVAA